VSEFLAKAPRRKGRKDLNQPGPLADGSGSLVIVKAESTEAARAIFREDPWAQRDILVADEVKEWTIFLDARDKAQG